MGFDYFSDLLLMYSVIGVKINYGFDVFMRYD